jgi:hypothetical protein
MGFIAVVFVATFVIVFAVAYRLFVDRKKPAAGEAGPAPHDVTQVPDDATTFEVSTSGTLPVSPGTVDLASRVVDAFVKRPPPFPEHAATMERIASFRGALFTGYRGVMILIGVLGSVAGAGLLLSHTPANQLGLPGGILLLLSLGALLNGLVPKRSLADTIGPLDFRPLLDKVQININQNQPLRVSMTEAQMTRAVEMIRDGLPISEAARTVYPEFDRLDTFSKAALESALQEMAKSR